MTGSNGAMPKLSGASSTANTGAEGRVLTDVGGAGLPDLPPQRFWSGPAGSLWRGFSLWLTRTHWAVWLLVTINLGSAVIGYIYWYGSDILAAPIYQWPLVPDSPLSATLWAFALLAVYRGRRWDLLGLMAATGCIKYGLWTDWIWFTNALSGSPYSLEAVVMSLNHFGMVLEGLVLVPLLRPKPWHIGFVAVWYGLNDLVDYWVGSHPRVPNPEDMGLISTFAVGTTLLLVIAWTLLYGRTRGRPSPGRD
jgi:uncharacterized membrane protein YpjA